MTGPDDEDFKLNLFALPSQTTLLFALIITMVLGTVILGGLERAPVLIWPLAVGLVLLPLRAFLARPEYNCSQFHLTPAGPDLARLQQAIAAESARINLPRCPGLLVSTLPVPLHTFGSFRRWYIAAGYEDACQLQNALLDPLKAGDARAILLHELHHFKNGDHWKLGYTRELLQTTFALTGWAIVFNMGLGLLLLVAAQAFQQFDPVRMVNGVTTLGPEAQQMLLQVLPSEAAMAEVRVKAAEIDLLRVLNFGFAAILPIIVVVVLLRVFYWSKLWRTRELYADAGMVHTLGTSAALYQALVFHRASQQKPEPEKPQNQPSRDWLAQVRGALAGLGQIFRFPWPVYGAFAEGMSSLPVERNELQAYASKPGASPVGHKLSLSGIGNSILSLLSRGWRAFIGLIKVHPDSRSRLFSIEDPSLIFGSWLSTAILLSSLVLLLDVLISSPLTLLYIGQWPMHFTTLIVLVTTALGYLLPCVAQGKPVGKDLLRIVSVVAGLRLVWLLPVLAGLVLMLILVPEILSQTLDEAVSAIARYAGYSDGPAFSNLSEFVFETSYVNLAQILIIFAILIASLLVTARLLERLFTWYSFPRSQQRLMNVAYLVTGGTLFVNGTVVLPLATTALLRPEELFTPALLLQALFGGLITATGLVLFLRLDRKYAGRCPNCNALVSEGHHLGKRCQNCGLFFFPWLIAEYES